MSHDLSIRLTKKYVGTYSHLDDWESIGSFKVLASNTVDHNTEDDCEEPDVCEPQTTTAFVEVQAPGETEERIRQALRETNTKAGCHHEHDCCGCRSYYVSDEGIEHLKGAIWRVTITSSRNY